MVLNLSEGNLAGLRDGEPLLIDRREASRLGLANVELLIVGGRTRAEVDEFVHDQIELRAAEAVA